MKKLEKLCKEINYWVISNVWFTNDFSCYINYETSKNNLNKKWKIIFSNISDIYINKLPEENIWNYLIIESSNKKVNLENFTSINSHFWMKYNKETLLELIKEKDIFIFSIEGDLTLYIMYESVQIEI